MSNLSFRNRKGFTLIELLVVISIIAILVVVGLVSFTDAQRKAKNSQKISDLKALQSAYEQYYSTNTTERFSYSTSCGTMETYSGIDSTNHTGFVKNCDADSYCVCVKLDNGQGNATNDACTGTTGQYQCIENQQ
ncbi:MAG: type II secretion system protein [Candidatus Pacebacteria bacterium]|nr:type II secretion system protein [Candidatus Paceibacterota bacterium]